ncbi:hypothetical protein ACN28C_13015 [Plantactinospora sp. WMMC1484]|uniref:hypothetical protein n=1 Tax=Plantactinospora sp. WMMC1484 TaxID=3404122 RepID=UPI003BF4AE98
MTGEHDIATSAGPASGAGLVVGLSLGHRTEREAEHWLREQVLPFAGPELVACTHLVAVPHPHVAISLAPAGTVPEVPPTPPELRDAAGHAAAEHLARRSGRAVRYPGVDRLVGVLTVADLLAASAIARVTVLGSGGEPDPGTPVETRDFVRPHWRDGRLTLVTTPVAGNRIGPFEVPDPTPCCADHP